MKDMSLAELHVATGSVPQENQSTLSDPNEDSIALVFAEKYKQTLKYDHTQNSWYVWDGICWKPEKTELAFDFARQLCREFNQHNRYNSLPKLRTSYAVEKFAQADRRFALTHNHWNSDPWLLCTPDCTIDLRNGNKRPNDPDNFITKSTAVGPVNMPTPLWDKFLHETTQGDKDTQKFLQLIAGYCLTGSTKEQVLFFIHGPGGNGKSVYVDTLSNVMGEYATAASMDTFTSSKHDRHPTELAHLFGARIVTASETEEGRAWAESRIKALTGEDLISARYMRQDFFEFRPQFKLIFLGNHKPVLHNVDDAMRRRFHIIPFAYRPKTIDRELKENLSREHGGILQWMIDGCIDWQESGLTASETVKRETDAYFADQDIFSQWLIECTEKNNIGESSTLLFESWKKFAIENGGDAKTMASLKEALLRAGYLYKEKLPGIRKRGFLGISIRIKDRSNERYID